PEQAADTQRADARADVYGLGCTLFYLLTGKAPFEGKTPLETVLAHREQPIRSLASVRSDVSPAVEAVFRKMVARNPESRYPSRTAVCAHLDRVLAAPPGQGHRSRWGRWLAAATVTLAASVLLALAWPSLFGEPETASQPAAKNHPEAQTNTPGEKPAAEQPK